MEDCLHTSSENLSKLVRWAHSHGTICALIPNLKHLLTEGSHGNLTAMWGCSAGHAYHWPLPATCKTGQKERGGCFQDSRSINSDSLSVQGGASARQSSPGGERFLGRSTKAKGGDSSQTRDSCDFSNCSDDNTEADDNAEEYNNNLFDIVCESSATTDEDGDVDYEPHHRPRKRGPPGGMPGPQRPGSEDRGQGDKSVKKIKQETAEDFYSVPKAQLAAGVGTDSGLASHSVSQSPKPNNSLSHHALPHKPLQLDADCLVGGVSSSLLGHSFPHKPLRGSISSSVSKPSMMSTSSPRHQDLSSVSTQGLSTLPGAGSELMEDLLNHGGSEGPLGNLTPSSPSGMNPDLDLLGAETKGEATDVIWPTSSSHCLTSEPAEERRRVEEFVARIDLGQLQSLQTVIHQVLSFRDKKMERGEDWKTERGEERRTERGQDWKMERGEDWKTERGQDWKTERGEERRTGRGEERTTERGQDWRMERGEDWKTEREEERRTERRQYHEDRAPSHYPQPHIYQPNTHQQQTQFQSHLETHQPQLQPQPEPTRWRGRHREQLQGQQELYPGSGVLLSSLQLAAMFQEARGNCMRLFHLLFEHFFTEEDLIGAVAFGRRGKVPDGKKILDRRTVDAIIVGPALCEIERLRALLSVERSRSEQMGETISSLKQDKELLQQELTKKAELICDFLQDQLRPGTLLLRPEKRRGLSSSQMELGTGSSSHMGVGFPDEGVAFENPALFDSFEEVELHRVMKSSKRSRDGENTRVRMKNVVGVIARYMAALQEFRRSVSMKVAFDRVGVDRNTISRTAAIAELSLAAPEVFHALPPWDEKEETLAHYAHRCRQAMDDTIRAKIKTMKTKGDLLPIVSK